MTRRELERIRRQYRSVKVLAAVDVVTHLIPSAVLLFSNSAWAFIWLILGGVVALVVYNLIALIFGLERGFPAPEPVTDDRCSRGPAIIDYRCPTSAGYWLDQDRY